MNRIKDLIEQKQNNAFLFKPNRGFYTDINIKQRRFGQLLRNEKQPTLDEAHRIADYFEVSFQDVVGD